MTHTKRPGYIQENNRKIMETRKEKFLKPHKTTGEIRRLNVAMEDRPIDISFYTRKHNKIQGSSNKFQETTAKQPKHYGNTRAKLPKSHKKHCHQNNPSRNQQINKL